MNPKWKGDLSNHCFRLGQFKWYPNIETEYVSQLTKIVFYDYMGIFNDVEIPRIVLGGFALTIPLTSLESTLVGRPQRTVSLILKSPERNVVNHF